MSLGRNGGRGRRNARLLAATVALATLMSACVENAPQDALDPEGPVARTQDTLFKPVFWIAVGVFILVEALIVYCVVRFRARSDDDAPVQIHGSRVLETTWTIIPALLLAGIGIFTIRTVFEINDIPEGPEVVNVNVIGHRWWWEYRYPDSGVITANEMMIPAGRRVVLTLESADVIHSFWPPKLAGKVDVIPGQKNRMVIEADDPGVYYGQCAEYCGLSHANMRLKVIAHSPRDFDEWVRNQQRPAPAPPTTTTTTAPAATTTTAGAADDVDATTGSPAAAGPSPDASEPEVGTDPIADRAAGAELFITKGCSGCHSVTGLQGANGRVGPNLTHLYSRSTFAGSIFELNEKNLRKWLRDPPAMKPMAPDNGQGMPNLGLSEDEITQLIAYLETLK